jgi:DNA-binding LacI/PurR family transcriptional regulator
MPTINDVARLAKVANSTVSRALRDDQRIARQTRDRIKQVADSIGYRPNPMVAALMSQLRTAHPPAPTCNLAWLDFGRNAVEWKERPVQRAFYLGACERAAASNYALERVQVRTAGMTPSRLAQVLRARNIRGVLVPYFEGSDGLASSIPLPLDEFNIVSVGAPYRNPALHFSSNDQYESSRLAVLELHQLGYRRIGYIGGHVVEAAVHNRFCAGFYTTARFELGLDPPAPLLSADRAVITKWLRHYRPDAVIATHLNLIKTLRADGWKIPDELGVASMHVDAEDADTSGIYQNSEYVGAAAVATLIGQLSSSEQGVPLHPQGVLIPGIWMPGKTVRRAD